MSCECYKIGGPFIAEDPDCPAHGREAQQREAEREAELTALKAAAFDPKKLRIALDTRSEGYGSGGATRIAAMLYYDDVLVSEDSVGIYEGEAKSEW